MSVKIGNLEFDNATYDALGDVLYLHTGERHAATDSEQTRKATCSASTPRAGSSA